MLEWIRETKCNWVFSCKALETNMTLLNRKKEKGRKYIKTGEKTLEEYFKLFLYGEAEKIMVKGNGDEYKEISANMSSGKIQKKELYVYYAEPLECNNYEIMISNIPPSKENRKVFESYNFRWETFTVFLKQHTNYDIYSKKVSKS